MGIAMVGRIYPPGGDRIKLSENVGTSRPHGYIPVLNAVALCGRSGCVFLILDGKIDYILTNLAWKIQASIPLKKSFLQFAPSD
jgi:hypothetical protein